MFQHEEPLILVTNDDGVQAPGIKSLIDAVSKLGKVVVVAPSKPQSGVGHAITIHKPIRVDRVYYYGNIEAYQCSGTPVDCVKIASDKLLPRKPDICVSGINHGLNASINVIYSGTMSAAMEASIEGIPAIGFSLDDFSYEANFDVAKLVVNSITKKMLNLSNASNLLLNVNIPKVTMQAFKGIKICRQADAKWGESFEQRTDPHGKNYYWMVGNFINKDKGEDTDIWALKNNYASIVPIQYDLTHYNFKQRLEDEWEKLNISHI